MTLTAITMTVLTHPFQVVLMAMVLGKLVRLGLSGRVEAAEGERIVMPTQKPRQAARTSTEPLYL